LTAGAGTRAADPRLKLCVALAALGISLATPRPASALVLAGCALAGLLAGDGRRSHRRALLAALGLGVFAGALRALFTPGSSVLSVSIAGHALRLSAAGATQGALVVSRVLAGTLVGAWLTSTTPFPQLVAALAWARVPAPLLEIVLLAHRHRHALGESLDTVRCAQEMRLGYVGLRRSVASAAALVGAAACRAIDQAGAAAEAMQVRGDRGLAALSLPESCPAADVFLAGCGTMALVASGALAWGVAW
jgi:cobalt/nickel transport system permease protein